MSIYLLGIYNGFSYGQFESPSSECFEVQMDAGQFLIGRNQLLPYQ